jgi:hypothetical protein
MVVGHLVSYKEKLLQKTAKTRIKVTVCPESRSVISSRSCAFVVDPIAIFRDSLKKMYLQSKQKKWKKRGTEKGSEDG